MKMVRFGITIRISLFTLLISLFPGCTGNEEVLVVVTPKTSTASPAAPLLQGSYGALPPEVLSIFEESLLARAGSSAAQSLISSWKAYLYGAQIGKGIWDVKGKGQWLIKEVGRSVQPLDSEAGQLLKELEALKPIYAPTPIQQTVTPSTKPGVAISPTPSPAVTPSITQPPAVTPTVLSPKSTPGAPAGWPIYVSKSWKYAIYYPPGWSLDESNPESVELVSPDSDSKIVIKNSYLTKSIDQWTSEKLDSIALKLWDFQLLFKQEFSKGALKGWEIAYTGRPPGNLGHNEYRDLMVSDGEALFWVSAYTSTHIADYMAALEIGIQSFELSPHLVPTPSAWWYIK